MAGALTHTFSHVLLDAFSPPALIEESDVLFPAKSYHHSQVMIVCDIEQPARWDRIGANRVRTHARNTGEISGYGFWIVVEGPICCWTEWAVCYAANEKFFFAGKNEFAADFGAHERMRGRFLERRAAVELGVECNRGTGGRYTAFAVHIGLGNAQQFSGSWFAGTGLSHDGRPSTQLRATLL